MKPTVSIYLEILTIIIIWPFLRGWMLMNIWLFLHQYHVLEPFWTFIVPCKLFILTLIHLYCCFINFEGHSINIFWDIDNSHNMTLPEVEFPDILDYFCTNTMPLSHFNILWWPVYHFYLLKSIYTNVFWSMKSSVSIIFEILPIF